MYRIRLAEIGDARQLSEIRLQIDGETENLDRQRGEDFIDEAGFREIIQFDKASLKNLFLVAEIGGDIVGFSRCEGNVLSRSSHKVIFGVAILKAQWGNDIGSELLAKSIQWADNHDIRKMTLSVIETNKKAIDLYGKFGFEIEGCLKADKKLADGKYYDTYIMSKNTKEKQ
ncbi:GNAT family N-acetyltransferase [Listeria rustica]|uniref:N-acetyltransferase n=1 Tax=Listeria rustica TaxID=2713503 RepID=A0A7W1YF70_9LIST|nr:GNAT family N-acetyltransferase [Listeria rustica]MBA3925278.1 N-acetyltransferase [Listeria rustica]